MLLVAHHQRDDAAKLALAAADWLTERGHSAFMTRADADALSLEQLRSDAEPSSADLVVSLGGDGTMLRAVQMLEGAAVPIIGVNVGLLGYLSEVEPPAMTLRSSDSPPDLSPIVATGSSSERMMVDVVVVRRDADVGLRRRALAGVERGRPREARSRPHRSAGGQHRRRAVHVVRSRRPDRRDAHRLDGVLAVGSRARWCRHAIGRCC